MVVGQKSFRATVVLEISLISEYLYGLPHQHEINANGNTSLQYQT